MSNHLDHLTPFMSKAGIGNAAPPDVSKVPLPASRNPLPLVMPAQADRKTCGGPNPTTDVLCLLITDVQVFREVSFTGYLKMASSEL